MAAKKYTVLRPFDRQDPSGKTVHFEPGATYDGPDIDLYLAWPDDGGALVTDVSPDNKGAE